MKKNIISILLVLSVLFMFSCEMKQASDPSGTNITSNVSSTENPDEKNFFLVEGDKAITIVCGENALDSEFKAAVYLRDIISKMTGTEPELTNDFDGSQDNSLRREILIGETNRAESKAALESIDEQELVIQVSGNKLVITGSPPELPLSQLNVSLPTALVIRIKTSIQAVFLFPFPLITVLRILIIPHFASAQLSNFSLPKTVRK